MARLRQLKLTSRAQKGLARLATALGKHYVEVASEILEEVARQEALQKIIFSGFVSPLVVSEDGQPTSSRELARLQEAYEERTLGSEDLLRAFKKSTITS